MITNEQYEFYQKQGDMNGEILTPGNEGLPNYTLGNVQGRNFDSGAYRDTDEGKYDYEGFLSPLVIERYGEYMNKHRMQSNGVRRDSDNWQLGIPKDQYVKSGWRHFFDWWKAHRDLPTQDGIEDALCALIFNAMGYLHELLKDKKPF